MSYIRAGRASVSFCSRAPNSDCGSGRRETMTHKKKNISALGSRRNTVSITLSDVELAAIDEYCAMFGERSRASVIREGAIRFVRKKLIDRHTCLFPEDDCVPDPVSQRKVCEPLPSLFDFVNDELPDDK